MRNFDLKIIRRQLATLNLQVNFIKELAFDLRYDLRKCLSFYFFLNNVVRFLASNILKSKGIR